MNCGLCGSALARHLIKKGANDKPYNVDRCTTCTAWQINPLPTSAELDTLYQNEYFKTRSDRGYADYTSPAVFQSVVSTLEKNLNDLNFFKWEKENPQPRMLLEVGCAAGHAVEYFSQRGWRALGIDIASEMIAAGKKIGRPLVLADFLTYDFGVQKFDLITHWATLEHLNNAPVFLGKMAGLLAPGGKIYLSTCNTGFFARIRGKDWRYLNVPEHVYYFNYKSLKLLAQRSKLRITRAFSYGSGFTTRAGAGIIYRSSKLIADRLARFCLMGDMIVVELMRIAEN